MASVMFYTDPYLSGNQVLEPSKALFGVLVEGMDSVSLVTSVSVVYLLL